MTYETIVEKANSIAEAISSMNVGDKKVIAPTKNTFLTIKRYTTTATLGLTTPMFPKDPWLWKLLVVSTSKSSNADRVDSLKLLYHVACDYEDSVNAFDR